MTKQTINKAYQALLKRLNNGSEFDEYGGFWNRVQPAFEQINGTFGKLVNEDKYGLIKLSLVYSSTTGYNASICDADGHLVLCLLTKDDFDKINPWLKGWTTMRRCKANLSNDDFKRIWLMTVISYGRDLYKLGHNGKPFLKAGETIESLALEYDLLK